ncbi:hypothetical protein ABENE_05505, partial [Asticcacaulis benevestitus DSM 16100 = ATCC BAA-896]
MADILVPVLGESVTEASIAKWTKKSGETVKKDEVLVELETDKVSLEVASPSDGVLTILVGEGETVTPGVVLGTVGGAGSSVSPAAVAAPAATPAAAPAPVAAPAAAPAAAPSASGTLLDVKTPVMGESVAEGAISTWRKKKGDAVKKDEILVEIETDKVAVEVASPADGTLADILAADGATVTPGQVIARISTDGSVAASAPAAAPAPVAA